MPHVARGYFLDQPGAPLAPREFDVPQPAAAEAVVDVLACGLCHTDLAFASGAVPPRHVLPLILGHEAVGTVMAAGADARHLLGRPVIVPAVLPCGRCAFCQAGRGNACPDQKMPGNDINGAFATHLLVPAAPLVPIDDLPPSVDARVLSVVADAVSTAYQAIRRAEVQSRDAVFVVGGGGVGGFVVQIARALGARVALCDVADDRLELMSSYGAEHTVNVRERPVNDVRKELSGLAKRWDVPSFRTRIFECSGTPQGQALAFALQARGSTLLLVGYTPEAVQVRLSNLMAFDATVHGTWGCPPDVYPDVLRLIADGRVQIDPFVAHAPMSDVNRLLDDMAHHRLHARMVLDPRA
jgi:6-hydroxycyclohex-1-ene-1-carbonyl-CoA dehydrogenase